jgi:hypothetical protein
MRKFNVSTQEGFLTMPRSKQTHFQFVNNDNPEQSNHIETRRLVRRHVMQQHLKKRIKEQKTGNETPGRASSQESTTQISPASVMCDCFGGFEEAIAASKADGSLLVVAECSICGRSYLKTADSSLQVVETRPRSPLKEVGRLGSGRTDPFALYAIEMSPYMHGLLDHCESDQRCASMNSDTKSLQ